MLQNARMPHTRIQHTETMLEANAPTFDWCLLLVGSISCSSGRAVLFAFTQRNHCATHLHATQHYAHVPTA
jgi:hypothetical protein